MRLELIVHFARQLAMKRQLLLGIPALCALALMPAHAQSPQEPAPGAAFQVEVNYVEVDVTVTDGDGNTVTGLTRDDFELFEDAQPQTIKTFSYVDIPIEWPEPFPGVDRPISPDVGSNRKVVSGRMYAIVLDDLNISAVRTAQVRQQSRQFVERYLGAGDVATVVHTSGAGGASQDFTSDPQLLLASIDKFMGRKLRAQALERADEFKECLITMGMMGASGEKAEAACGGEQAASPVGLEARFSVAGGPRPLHMSDFERSQRAMGVLDRLKSLAELLSGISGRRKALVLFSEGIDYVEKDPFGMRGVTDVIRATQDTINMAARSNVNFYAIDPRGLVGATDGFMELAGSGLPQSGTSVALMDEQQITQDSLRTLAEETGGFAALNSNAVSSAFGRIVDSNSRYYVLGYYGPDHPRDGRFHTIDVRVKRPEMTVVARRGYASPRATTADDRTRADAARRARDAKRPDGDRTSAELRAVLDFALQQSGLMMSVHAAPFKHSDKDGSVALAIEIDGSTLQLAPPPAGRGAPNRLELSFFAIDSNGKASAGVRKELDLALTRETSERVKVHGLRFNPRIALAPGRYQMRIGARESMGGSMGSVFYDLIVPDFRNESLALSGLLLTSASAQQTPTAEPDRSLAKVLPGAATSRREFPSGDALAFYAELYGNNVSREPQEIDVAVRLVSEGGEHRFTSDDTIDNRGRQSERWDIGGRISLKDLELGRYLLRVQASLRGDNPATVARETVITIVEP
jgi:VWFA-related protein